MSLYAQDSDLDKFDTSIRDQGIDSFENQLTLASGDILNLIKTGWWEEASGGLPISSFDEANLNTGILGKITIYKAFADYIFPMMAKFTENDTFVGKIDFYQGKFEKEWLIIKSLPLYDFDESASFEDSERRGPIQRKVARG